MEVLVRTLIALVVTGMLLVNMVESVLLAFVDGVGVGVGVFTGEEQNGSDAGLVHNLGSIVLDEAED